MHTCRIWISIPGTILYSVQLYRCSGTNVPVPVSGSRLQLYPVGRSGNSTWVTVSSRCLQPPFRPPKAPAEILTSSTAIRGMFCCGRAPPLGLRLVCISNIYVRCIISSTVSELGVCEQIVCLLVAWLHPLHAWCSQLGGSSAAFSHVPRSNLCR